MLQYITGLIGEIWNLLTEMAPYLILGFFMAGILHIFIPGDKIYKHFGGQNLWSIIKASLFGVPLPLCSCGVIPVAAHLRKEGAGKSATMAFLISTPATGIDSIMATYALLGPLFAIIRPIAAFFSGIVGGVINNIFEKEETKKISEDFSCNVCENGIPHTHSWLEKIKTMFKYGFFELIEDISKWLVIGIIAGGVIAFFIPEKIIEQYLGNSFIAYPLMIFIAVPLYVCATGSIPIAASLILKGMTPGAGLVFLIAGPATNTATLSFVAGKLGKKSVFIYLITIIITALLFGLIIDYIWYSSGRNMKLIAGGMKMLPHWVKISSAVLLLILILRALLIKLFIMPDKKITGAGQIFMVPDMSCEHCVKTINTGLRKLKGIQDVRINLKNKKVEIIGNISKNNIISAINKAGYSVEKK